jgi:carboxypeptidase family protein
MNPVKISLVLALFLTSATQAGTQMTIARDEGANDRIGIIRGEIRDSEGKSVSDVRVYVQRPGRVTKPAPVVTNDEGYFEISHLKVGSYLVFVSKEHEGYADTGSSFYADAPEQIVLTSEKPVVSVVLTMPPRAAAVMGNVTDADSGEPIPGAQIRLTRSADPQRWIQFAASLGDAKFSTLVPAHQKIDVMISAAGFHSWSSQLEGLEPGTERELSAVLKRETASGPH